MITIPFIQTPSGKLVTFAAVIEDFLFHDLGLPYSSQDNEGGFHPGTKLNEIARRMYSRKYFSTLNVKREDWVFVESKGRNMLFIDAVISMKLATPRSVSNGGKLDCYTPDFLAALMTFLHNDGFRPNKPCPDINVKIIPFNLEPVFCLKVLAKPATQAAPLFTPTVEEEAEIAGSVISTFSEEEQKVIREYMERCKNTREARRKSRERANGKD